MKNNIIAFWKPNQRNGYLSNWYHSPFIENKIHYVNVEQYMMYQKAILFNDKKTAQQILNCTNPAEMKQLGRKVKNFDSNLWDSHKETIVFNGCLQKFKQNPNLKNQLLSTKNKQLVEFSPFDVIWGVGRDIYGNTKLKNHTSTNEPFNSDYWLGQNLLGIALMKVREELS